MTARRGRVVAFLRPLLRTHRGPVLLGLGAAILQTAAALTIPYLMKVAIDDGILVGNVTVLSLAALAGVVLAGLEVLAARTQIRAVARAGHGMLSSTRVALFAHLQRLPMQYHEHNRPGRQVASLTADIEAMSGLLTQGFVTLFVSTLTLAGTAVVLLLLDPGLAVACLVVMPVLALATRWFRRRSAVAWRQVRETATAVTVELQQALSAIAVIQAFRHERTTLDRFAAADGEERQAKAATVRTAGVYFPTLDLCSALATVAVLAMGARSVSAEGLEIGTLTAFLLYLRGFFSPIYELSSVYDTLQSAVAGAERVIDILATPVTVSEPASPARLPDPHGAVTLSDVTFAYPDHDGLSGPDVLHDVDLAVAAGSTLVIIGPSGAGKSTLVKLMLRFYDPQRGRVTLDGVDVRRLAHSDLRRAIAYVPQEGYLFTGSISDNIRMGNPTATDDEIEAAARTLGVWSVLSTTSEGLDTPVGVRGTALSASQRQVIAILRAWMADPTVLIWDEATSSLDVETDQRVQDATRLLRTGRTMIVVTHDLLRSLDADSVALVRNGRVVAYGTPAELLATERWLSEGIQRPTLATHGQPAAYAEEPVPTVGIRTDLS
ncbi:ABC transporter ATP-binding protein [Micromonospora sp. WMMD1128]|uniref:ABC transporter ATP-binding protein n=1 Tax=Micromonospora sp. WMMD1128 TaxID=3015150 RepID=UPI00248CAABD|nr:ABC transporter ATP-binding protein [Micromonospora sp. WMMD1128]WBB73015.1 ABC transporter ATP-binding protein [Micromonospora sp. WMMD1128]